MTRLVFSLSATLVASLGFICVVGAAEPFDAFLEKHCISCHGPEKQKGDLRIDQLLRDFKLGADTHHWAEVIEQINSGEMPPKKEKRPMQDEIAAFVTHLDSLIKEGRAARMAARPAVAHYRMSRKEYQNTVYDLFGVRYDPTKPGGLNEDTLWHGFERIGSELSLSPSHVDRYYRAAELVLDRAFPAAPKEARKVRKTAAELRYGGGEKTIQEALDRFGIKRPLRCLIYPGNFRIALSSGWLGKTGPETSGLYKLRFQASGIRPLGGQPTHLSVGTETGSNREAVNGLIELDITAPEDSPEVYEYEVVAEHLQRFAERAWRRPVKMEELADYLESFRAEREAGEKTADAYRLAMLNVLTSRNFICLVEGDPVAREQLTDWELASRLSYFLWSSMPDDGLFGDIYPLNHTIILHASSDAKAPELSGFLK
jgi:hypothetical protein